MPTINMDERKPRTISIYISIYTPKQTTEQGGVQNESNQISRAISPGTIESFGQNDRGIGHDGGSTRLDAQRCNEAAAG